MPCSLNARQWLHDHKAFEPLDGNQDVMARVDLILAAIAVTALLSVFAWTAFH